MDVLLGLLSTAEREDPLWLKIEAFLNERKQVFVNKLIAKESDEVRGRVKELMFLLSPPGQGHTAHSNDPRESADQGGF